MRGLRDAVLFLTRLPLPAGRDFDLRRAAPWFPAVGLLVGGTMGGVRLLGDLAGVDPAPATVLAVLAAVLVTGGFHEDGLADAADAAGAHVGTRERRLEILKDSRVGTYGALAVAFMVVLPVVVLAPLSGTEVLRAALAAHVLGRWSTLPLAWRLRPAVAGSSGSLVSAGPGVVGAGTVVAAAVLVLCAGGAAPAAAAGGTALVLTAAVGGGLARSFGGSTGDGFGATNKAVELGTYVALAAAW